MIFTVLLLACATRVMDASFSSRIIGGVDVDITKHPWQASLKYKQIFFLPYSHICGASILNENTLVTAAHCVDGKTNLQISVGGTNQKEHEITHDVSSVIMHTGWNSTGNGYPNDIAIIHLSTPLDLTVEGVSAINLPTNGANFEGMKCTLTGWGKFNSTTSSPDILQEVLMPVISNAACNVAFSTISGATVSGGHICVEAEGKSSCSGDSGGPMVCTVDATPVLAGVTSWGINTCDGFPSVYTRVSQYLEFIKDNMST